MSGDVGDCFRDPFLAETSNALAYAKAKRVIHRHGNAS
jgi:hypothetical protein